MSQPRALLVVDSPGLGLFYRDALAGAGLDVIWVRDAESALGSLKSHPVIAAVDLYLPGMSGIEFIRTLKAQRSTVTPPVVVLPLMDPVLASAANAAGAARVLNRDTGAIRTLALLAHAQARLRGTPTDPLPPNPATWLPCAQDHIYALHEAVHLLTRDVHDPVARRQFGSEIHGLNEMLLAAGEDGCGEIAQSMEAFFRSFETMEPEVPRSAIQTLGQALDFLGKNFENFEPGRLRSIRGAAILVVDDEPSVCQLVSAALEMVGLSVRTAATPSDCLSALLKEEHALVILDIGLPEMSGFDLCSHVRSTPGHEKVPILFLTGMSSFQNRAKSALLGGNEFIAKPFHPLELALKAQLWAQISRG